MVSRSKTTRGFTLLEMMAAMAIGIVVIGAATELFKSGMDASALVTQQAEMQQNVRSALNLVARDVSMAGSGLPAGGLSLPYGTGSGPSKFGCDQTATCYINGNTYFSGTVGGSTVTNHMYGLQSGANNGIKAGSWTANVPATGTGADSVTSAYVDYSFPLDQYDVAFSALGDAVTLTPPVGAPASFPKILSPTGLSVGDLILFSNSNGTAIGEVTGLTPQGGGVVTAALADNDALNINQSGASDGQVNSIMGSTPFNTPTTVARRLWAISYYIEVPTTASRQTPRLMRQVSGFAPQPVADNIIGLRLTYDTCDDTTTGTTCAALPDPVAAGFSLNNVHKVNIQVIGQSVFAQGNKSRSMALVTSVSTRSLSFKSRY
jgi:prepilin-type N-terminal cleavage/methylation domain-containing protein